MPRLHQRHHDQLTDSGAANKRATCLRLADAASGPPACGPVGASAHHGPV